MSEDRQDVERARLRWRCRRGMRELDLLLENWLQRDWPGASAEQRSAFESLLDTEDDLLWAWVTGQQAPANVAIAALVERLRERVRE
ncbi:MAG: hypothetical protein CVV18_07720 [Gammaproteobacteria bacterium HGW-Gammaproteobacteria-8]|nr:MAG: hypothetical protein CVV18_07720 [Gammaproteobacteria bacterium HGW-Gammaproteobacteria-8]